MKIVASIQVRMNSSRLKGKALKKICGKTSLEWVIESVKKSKYVDDFIVATTVDKTDDKLVAFLEGIDVKYYRGDIENVGERLFKSAKELNADYVVRIVGDHPLNSYELLDFLIEKHLEESNDFTSVNRDNIAVGILSEIISMNAFEKLMNSQLDFSYSEYLTFFFLNNERFFKIGLYNSPEYLQSSNYRLTLDYIEDFQLIKEIIKTLQEENKEINHTNILTVINTRPSILKLNSSLKQKFQDKELLEIIRKASTIKI
jgi:spore coat polysaccharide biosynthesis protein SpsF